MRDRRAAWALWSALALGAVSATAQDETLVLDHAPSESAPVALFADDRWNRALACPRGRVRDAPAGTLRCRYQPVARFAVGRGDLIAAATYDGHEHDGMYSRVEALVLLSVVGSSAPRLAHTMRQWHQSVDDGQTEVVLRRRRVRDLDGDGETELCVETVRERGVGLFALMDLEDRGRRWFPAERGRDIVAFAHDEAAGRLLRRPELDARCPRVGYRLFVETEPLRDGVAWRRRVQGDAELGVARGRRLARWARRRGR